MIGHIHLTSSKGHKYILAVIDYFTKWVVAVPMKNVTSLTVIRFANEHIIYRF
jgi:hypothetical protein